MYIFPWSSLKRAKKKKGLIILTKSGSLIYTVDKKTENWKTRTEEKNWLKFLRLSIILKRFLKFCKFEPCDSYKKNSYKKTVFDWIFNESRWI